MSVLSKIPPSEEFITNTSSLFTVTVRGVSNIFVNRLVPRLSRKFEKFIELIIKLLKLSSKKTVRLLDIRWR